MWGRAYLGWVTPDRYVAVEVMSLYWHLVDAIWLFLMPLLYLAGPHHSLFLDFLLLPASGRRLGERS